MSVERRQAIGDFLAASGWDGARLDPLPGDASSRHYMRVARGSRTAMLMDQPQNAETPPARPDATDGHRRALGYNAVARLAGADCARFVAVAEYLRGRGLSAPDILAADPAGGLVLLEDLGDALFSAFPARAQGDEPYDTAIDALVRLHGEAAPRQLGAGTMLHAYDELALEGETRLLPEWFLPLALGRSATAEEMAEHDDLWRAALAPVVTRPPLFVHRDYHAGNLIWLPQRVGVARVGVIDFQDAVAGSRAYDLVSLIEDARRDVAPEAASRATARYLAAMRAQGTPLDEEQFRAEMAVIAAQRNAKIVGIFARLHIRDGKPRYLGFLPRVWRHLEGDLGHPALASLKAWYDRVIPQEKRNIEAVGAAS